MKVMKQVSHVLRSSDCEDVSSDCIEDGLQPSEQTTRDASKNRVAVVKYADHESGERVATASVER